LIRYLFKDTKGRSATLKQGLQTPFGHVPGVTSTFSAPTLDTLPHDQIHLKGEITEVKQALTEEKALNAKRHVDLLNAISALTAKFASLPPLNC